MWKGSYIFSEQDCSALTFKLFRATPRDHAGLGVPFKIFE
jgi:hypothetical protein